MSHQKGRYPVNKHDGYHAHVYFDEVTKDFAWGLCSRVASKFNLPVGRFHEKLVGPHPFWSCQILFGKKDFDQLIPWLDSHRGELSVLVHALSGDDLTDHTEYAYWLGDSAELNLEVFARSQ